MTTKRREQIKREHSDDIRPPKAPGTRATEQKPPVEDDRPRHEDEDLSGFIQNPYPEEKPKK
jgi:hypothetical protein